jgi:hypothetical protein
METVCLIVALISAVASSGFLVAVLVVEKQ